MQEILILSSVDYATGKTSALYDIPDGIDPNRGSKACPEIPILIQVLVSGDYKSALRLIRDMNADVNVKSMMISKMGGNKPAHSTPLMALIHQINEDNSKQTNSLLGLFSFGMDEAMTVLNLLLERGANVNDQDCMGFTALHLLVNNSNISYSTKSKIVDLLLMRGADKTIEMPKYGTSKSLAKLISLDTIQPEVYNKL